MRAWFTALLVALLGCSGQVPDLDLGVTPPVLRLSPGETGQLLVILRPQGGFSGEVYLGLVGKEADTPPPWVSGGGVVVRVRTPYTTADFFVKVETVAPPGTHTLRVLARSGNLVRYASFDLDVSHP